MASTEILQLARDQFGIVGREQLIDDLEMSPSAIGRLTADGRLLPQIAGVYRLASAPDTFLSRCMTVQLWSGGIGFISSWSAGRIRGLRRMPAERIHFTVPSAWSRRSPGWIHLDRTSWYDESIDRVELGSGLVVASSLRMMFGLAADLTQFRFDRAAEDAWHRGLTTPSAMGAYLEAHRCRGKDGVATMQAFVDKAIVRPRPAQSGLEQEFIDAFEHVMSAVTRQHELQIPSGETVKLDIAWPTIRLAVEPGSSWFHGGDLGQARDHDRDLACNEVGWMIIRLDESFRFDPAAAARRVKRVYDSRRRDLLGARFPAHIRPVHV